MELHWLSILVLTIMVSNSTQSHHDTPQDNNSQKKGILNAMKLPQLENMYPPVPYQYQQSANQYQPLANQYQPSANQYQPLTNTEINNDNLQPFSGNGLYTMLKRQQEPDARKLKKLMSTLKTALPQLITLLQDNMDPAPLPIFPVMGTR